MDHANMESGKKDIFECRSKLDKALMSDDLSIDEKLRNLVRNQLLQSTNLEFEGAGSNEDEVEKRSRQVSNLLRMLRSASFINHEKSKSGNESDKGWRLKADNDEYRVMYCEGPANTPFHNLLVEGYVDGPLDAALCISLESDLYKEWWPEFSFPIPTFRVIMSERLQRLRTGDTISQVRLKLPWPLSVREALVKLSPFEYLQEDLVVVTLNSISDSENTHGCTWEAIPNADGAVRIDVVGGLVQQKVSANRTYVRAVANIDVKLDFLPIVLINFISRQIIGSGFKLFKKEVGSVSKGSGNIFDEHLKDPFYSRIREALYSRKNLVENPKISSESITADKHNTEETTEGDDSLFVDSESKSGRFKDDNKANEIEELEEDRVKESKSHDSSTQETQNGIVKDREYLVPMSPEVKQALKTLDSAISIIRGRIQIQHKDTFSPNMEKELVVVEESLYSEADGMSRKKENPYDHLKLVPQKQEVSPSRHNGSDSSPRETSQTKMTPASSDKYGSRPPNPAAYSWNNHRSGSMISSKTTGNSHLKARNKRSGFAACISFGRLKERS